MKFSDYKCDPCKVTMETMVTDTESFPEIITCVICGENMKRVFSPLPSICHQGKVGNSANGYKSNLGPVKKT